MQARFAVGIDLGTTNSVVAWAPLDAEGPQLAVMEIPQLVAAGQVERRLSLPSFLYLPPEAEAAAWLSAQPGGGSPGVVGEAARRQGAESPRRVVAAAK